eukprot:CAMPEP_0171314740 /NCGR_PEP_ID=MMETSP0816-20121228/56644_1 /TAXON_ID=420281 /ORGANISM="Proboscia inermis, Strain CCAP1064/1" /LENGTH=58 /DNA_ID=CAMNT_0011804241 /DNA_START=668 /DNA_END=844 /DNA_ORIENTATION=+
MSAKSGTNNATGHAEHNNELNKHAPKDVTNKEPSVFASKPASNNDSVSIKPPRRGTTD